jgi:hypothetical protein
MAHGRKLVKSKNILIMKRDISAQRIFCRHRLERKRRCPIVLLRAFMLNAPWLSRAPEGRDKASTKCWGSQKTLLGQQQGCAAKIALTPH